MGRKKISFYNQHFAYVDNDLVEKLKERGITDIHELIKKEAEEEFGIQICSFDDVEALKYYIVNSSRHEKPSIWVKKKIEKVLNIRGSFHNRYKYELKDMVCLVDIQSQEDVEKYHDLGYPIYFTQEEFSKKYPSLDVHKVYFDNFDFLPHTVYYDKEKHTITEIMGGFTQAPYTIDNYQLVSLDNKTPEEMILFKMDYIYETLKNKDYEYFKYLLIPFYANEIMDILIREEKDTREKEKLIKAREVQIN